MFVARGRAACALAGLFVAALVLGAAGPADAVLISTFADGSSSYTYTFNGAGQLGTARVSIPKASAARAATVQVQGGPGPTGSYPSDVAAYASDTIGNGTQIYGYSGTGYGAMGLQSLFTNGRDSASHRSAGGGSATDPFYLPAGATVLSGSITIRGAPLDSGYTGPDTLNHQVGMNLLQLNTGARGAPYLVDIDGDGDLDLFATGGNVSGGFQLLGGPRFFRNIGNATSYRFQEDTNVVRGVTQGWGFSPALADLDGDGDFDLLVAGGPLVGVVTNVTFYWNTGTRFSPNFTRDNTVFAGIQTDGRTRPYFGDVNGDGLQDFLYGDSSGGLTYFENTGNSTRPQWTSRNTFGGINVGQNAGPALGDIDYDGDLDLVVGNGTVNAANGGPATFQYWENSGNATAPSWTRHDKFSGLHIGGSYTGGAVMPFLADLDGDGDLDIQAGDANGDYWQYYSIVSFPSGLSLDVGADGAPEWTHSSPLQGSATIGGLAGVIQARLNSTAPGAADAFGNRMTSIPISISYLAGGAIVLEDLVVAYTYSATSKDFSTILNRVRAGTPADSFGNIQMPIYASVSSAGTVTLQFLAIELDQAPTFTSPGTLSVNEDTRVDNLLDLTTVFSDDYTSAQALSFNVTGNSQLGIIGASINSGRWLGIDALTGTANDNWNGYVNVTVTATDSSGLSASLPLLVIIVPVNDPPVLAGISSSYEILEDQPWALTPQGTDADGDSLIWTLVGKPDGAAFDTGTGALRWQPLGKDVGNHTMVIYVSDGQATAQFSFVVTVLNVNDPPFLLPIPNQTVLEGVTSFFDLAPYYGDEDDVPYTLYLAISGQYVSLSGSVVNITVPKNSGLGVIKVDVKVSDPSGAAAAGGFAVLVIPAGPDLALLGVPDMQVVETVAKTVDLGPYLYNVKNAANVTVTASTAQATVSGTKVTFLYPKGYAADMERVRLSASEHGPTTNWTIVITIVRLGLNILIADLPDLDVVEGQEVRLDLTPYVHNLYQGGSFVASTDSSYVSASATELVIFYPLTSGVSAQQVTVRVCQDPPHDSDDDQCSADVMAIHVHKVRTEFSLDPLPDLNAVEGQPLVLFLSSYVNGADDLSKVTLSVASAYSSVSGLTVTFLYPVGSKVGSEQVTVVARYEGSLFTTVLQVSVASLGDQFTLAGVPNLVVFAGLPYRLSLLPYLYNLGGASAADVVINTSSAYVQVEAGPVLVFSYPAGGGTDRETVTIGARLGTNKSSQSIEVAVRQAGTSFALASIPDLYLTEDVPYSFDLLTFLLNAPAGSMSLITDSSYATVENVTWVELLYPGGVPVDAVTLTVDAGGQLVQGVVRVFVAQVNDPPRLRQAALNASGKGGDILVWDLTMLFTDEEDPANLTFAASDARVQVNNATKTATLTLPDTPGDLTFTLTAFDGQDQRLFVTTPPIMVTIGAAPAPTGAAQTSAGADSFVFLVFLLVGVGVALLLRRDGGRLLGATQQDPLFGRGRQRE